MQQKLPLLDTSDELLSMRNSYNCAVAGIISCWMMATGKIL